ncbi:hypothetical protein G7Y79_00027g061330 [Physcia stellaris]|nr:hypothetical protein G7Y79_00027g061330 [Physcia stellaris]
MASFNMLNNVLPFLGEIGSHMLEHPIESAASVTLSCTIAFGTGYVIYTKPHRTVVLPSMLENAARDREGMEQYLKHTVSIKLIEDRTRNLKQGTQGTEKETSAVNILFPQRFPYQSLPPEIRNQIAYHALGGRHIFLPQIYEVSLLPSELTPLVYQAATIAPLPFSVLNPIRSLTTLFTHTPPPPPSLPQTSKPKPSQHAPKPPAVPLLVASKRIYAETHSIYWSTNTFHLARGSYVHSSLYFDLVAPAHVAQIQNIHIDLSLADLTPTLIRFLEQRADRPGNHDARFWGRRAGNLIRQIWMDKFHYVRRTFAHVGRVRVSWCNNKNYTLNFSGAGFGRWFTESGALRKGGLKDIFELSVGLVEWIVEDLVGEEGWEGFKREMDGDCGCEGVEGVCALFYWALDPESGDMWKGDDFDKW